MTVSLLDLPRELILYILYNLDLPEYLSLYLVHSSFRPLIQSSSGLKYRFEAQVAGVTNNPYCKLNASERSRMLKRLEDGWSHLKFDFVTRVSTEFPIIPSLLRVTDGICILVGDDDASSGMIRYFALPSLKEDVPAWNKIVIGEDLLIVDLAVAIYEHDLLAVITTRLTAPGSLTHVAEIRFLQFSTTEPHPRAQKPIIFLCEAEHPGAPVVTSVNIVDEYVAILIRYGPFVSSHLTVINWATSDIQMSFPTDMTCYEDIIFLAPTLLLLPNVDAGTLDIFDISGNPVISTEPAVPPLSLSLPALSHEHHIANIFCPEDLRHTPRGTPLSSKPFHTSPEEGLLYFDIVVSTADSSAGDARFHLFVHGSALATIYSNYCKTSAGPTVMEWAAWGPPVTCWLQGSIEYIDHVLTAGQRCARYPMYGSMLTLYDFNARRARKALQTMKESGGFAYQLNTGSYLCARLSEDGWLNSPVFKEPVQNSLPYSTMIIREADIDFFTSNTTLSEEWLISSVPADSEQDTEDWIGFEVLHFGV